MSPLDGLTIAMLDNGRVHSIDRVPVGEWKLDRGIKRDINLATE